jgi:hypothetical protein
MPSELNDALLENGTLLDNLVGLHLIEEVHELWVYGLTRELNKECADEEYAIEDEDDEEYTIEGASEETLVFLVRIDGEDHALFNRGSPTNPMFGAVRQQSMSWPFSPHEFAPGSNHQDVVTPLMCHLFWRPDSDLPLTGEPDRVLIAVDEINDRIVLEIGIERYTYQVPNSPHKRMIPLLSGSRVPSGHSIRVISGPQQSAFRASRLIIGRDPGLWVVENIRLGGQSQIMGDIPGDVFAASSSFASLILPVLQPGQIAEITVRYTGEEQHGAPFIGALFGEVISNSNREPVTRIGRRYVARWTPEGRFEPWLATHLPGRDQVTGEDLPA